VPGQKQKSSLASPSLKNLRGIELALKLAGHQSNLRTLGTSLPMKINIAVMGRFYPVTQNFPQQLDLPAGSRVGEAIRALQSCIELDLSLVPQTLLAVSGETIGTVANYRERTLVDDDELILFSPVAGG
jgi:molybdopterin converting factor small subunit